MALRKCACIDTLYTELDWLDRFQAAKNDGFEAVEFWDWRIRDLDATREAAEKAGIAISGFNGDAAAAKKVGAASVTIHSNALGDGGIVVNHYDNLSHTVKLCSMYDTLLACAELAEKEEINLNLEALNITTDHVGNFLATTQMGAEIVRLIGCPRLKLLYDVYHMQINEGCICDTIWLTHRAATSRARARSTTRRCSHIWRSAAIPAASATSCSRRPTPRLPSRRSWSIRRKRN